MKAFDHLCRQVKCKFNNYKFLYERDTICPYFYNYNECYEINKGEMDKIKDFAFDNDNF